MAETILDFEPTAELRNDDVLHIVRNLSAGEAPGGIPGYYDMTFNNPFFSIDGDGNVGIIAPADPAFVLKMIKNQDDTTAARIVNASDAADANALFRATADEQEITIGAYSSIYGSHGWAGKSVISTDAPLGGNGLVLHSTYGTLQIQMGASRDTVMEIDENGNIAYNGATIPSGLNGDVQYTFRGFDCEATINSVSGKLSCQGCYPIAGSDMYISKYAGVVVVIRSLAGVYSHFKYTATLGETIALASFTETPIA
jgi:hypothetical protein